VTLRRHADFRRLWIGETVSQFGSAVSNLALPLVAILALHASPFQVGLLATCESLAFLLVGLPVGAWVDRMRFRHVLITNDLIRFAALASVPVAQGLGVLSIAQMYAVALITSVSTVFFDVAYQSYLPQLVERADLVEGNAKLQASESVAQVAAPAAGGGLIQLLTAPYAVVVDALSFLWSAAWVTAIRQRPARPPRAADRHLGREIAQGLRFVVGNRLLRAIAMCTACSNLFSSMGFAVFYVLLARELHVAPGVIGVLSAVSAVGGVVGSLVAVRVARRLGQGPTIWISTAISAPMMFVAPFVEHDWTLGVLAVAQGFWWSCGVVYNITQVSFRQGLCPPELLGRMNATMRFLVWGTLPLGAFVGGLLGGAIGVRATLLVAAVGGALAFVPPLLSPLRTMRELPSYQLAEAVSG
jgi:predicted MFS family arabinose efflux permease